MRLSVPVFIESIVPVLLREIMKESLADALYQFSAKVNFVNGKFPPKNKVPKELPSLYEIELTPAVPEFKLKLILFGFILIRNYFLDTKIGLTLIVKLFELTNDY